jgi:Leucine-rich repeat (LRR) protein
MTTPPSNHNPQVSQYERRLARQRQLEEMEAEASGAMPGMELDLGTSSSSQSDTYTSMRQRNHDTARRFLNDDDEQEQIVFTHNNKSKKKTTSAVHTGMDRNQVMTQSLFGDRRLGGHGVGGPGGPIRTSVNLMDHEAGVYQEEQQAVSILGRAKHLIFDSSRSENHHHHDAVAADETDGFVGIAGGDPSHKSGKQQPRATRCSSLLVMIQTICWSSKRRRLWCAGFVMILTLLIVVVSIVARAERLSPEEKKFQQNALRLHSIQDVVLGKGISHSDDFKDATSAESRALRWISYTDPARLDPKTTNATILLQRYVLAVLYYSSYIAFEVSAGKQHPIERDDDVQYQGVPNPGWRRSDYWMSAKGICQWYGVECPPKRIGASLISNGIVKNQYDENGMVLALNMTNNQVYGQLPSSLKALEAMYALDLSHNNIQGTFPNQVGYMFSIKTLYLHQNQMTGAIPADIGFLEQCQDLNLGHNAFTNTIPSEINRLYNLVSLTLQHNQLSGQVPWVSKLANLRTIAINDNRLNGTFPFTLARLSNLNEIHLHQNDLMGTIPPEIETLTNLQIFQVSNNRLTGRFPNGIFERNLNLKQVSIQDNELRGSIPSFAGQLQNLTTLQMHNNQFTGSIPQEWTQMSSLEILHLQDNRIHGILPAAPLLNMPALRELWVQDNDIMGEIPPEMAACTNLQQLFLNRNQLSGPIPVEELGQLTSLHTLRLEENPKLSGPIVDNETLCLLKSQHALSFLSVDCNNDVVQCDCCDKCY